MIIASATCDILARIHSDSQRRYPFLIKVKLAISIRPQPVQARQERRWELGMEAEPPRPPVPGKSLPPFRRFGDQRKKFRGQGGLIVPSLQGLDLAGRP
jgi:hypothetical protein